MNRPFWQLALYGIGVVFAVVMLTRWTHHRSATVDGMTATTTTTTTDLNTPPASAGAPDAEAATSNLPRIAPVNGQRILAECQPHLGPNPDFVPNLDVSRLRSPASLRLKVRFWVNGDGFTSNQFLDGVTNGIVPDDQIAALDFVRHLTFQVPNTPQCHERRMEMIGYFIESMDVGGQWATLFDVHPRLYIENGVVVNRPQ